MATWYIYMYQDIASLCIAHVACTFACPLYVDFRLYVIEYTRSTLLLIREQLFGFHACSDVWYLLGI